MWQIQQSCRESGKWLLRCTWWPWLWFEKHWRRTHTWVCCHTWSCCWEHTFPKERLIVFWQDYNLVRKSDFKQVRNIKVIPCEKVVTQHLLLVSDLKWKFVKQTKKAFTPKLRTWKLRDHNAINLFKDSQKIFNSSPCKWCKWKICWRSLDAS